ERTFRASSNSIRRCSGTCRSRRTRDVRRTSQWSRPRALCARGGCSPRRSAATYGVTDASCDTSVCCGASAAVGGLAVTVAGRGGLGVGVGGRGGRVKGISATDIKEDVSGRQAKVTTFEVTFEPGAGSSPHRRPGPVFGYVLEGELEFAVCRSARFDQQLL